MANKRIDMRKVRELLRLHLKQNVSARQAAKIIGIGKTAASQYISGFKSSGLDYSSLEKLSDTDLIQAINTRKETENYRYKKLHEQFPKFEKELKRDGVTLQLLWQEYKQLHPDSYGYSQFCHHYSHWRKEKKVSMHMEHKAGDKLFVDFTGKKLSVIDPNTGQRTEYEVFVAILGASQMSYVEAVPSQKKADWIAVNQNALRFYGGVPAAIVPDCLKSAVIKADKYEPEINESYNDFAKHYDTVILPARALHPQDKSLAENMVRNVYRQIFAPLRNQVFFSLEELNKALWEKLKALNSKNFQGRNHSRQNIFDQVEKQYLKPLPAESYELKSFCRVRVHYNYHIYLREDKHYYSVPYRYVGKQVMVAYNNRRVEIYFNNTRIASHSRSRYAYKHTTKDEHMPQNHQFVSQWSPQRFIKWAKKIGPESEQIITSILDSRKHPEQAYKSCMGILQLAKKHGQQDYLKACRKALALNCIQYKFIKNTLENKTFNLSTEEKLELITLPEHDNIRGKESFN
jgi:transposase